MISYIIRRVLIFIPVLIGITIIVQFLIVAAPGDPARIIVGATEDEGAYERVREELHLDDPIYVRYWRFISGVMRGDFGTSWANRRPILPEILARWSYTVRLATISVVLAAIIGIPLGIFAATHQYTLLDNGAILLSLAAVSMPNFWFALLLVQLFSVRLGLVPVAGVKSWQGWILPVLSLALGYAASITRQMRSNMLEVVRQDYIVTVRAKGLTERKVLFKHACKNALIPVLQIIGSIYGMALGGALVAEMIFSIPGLGSYTLTGLINRDYPVVQANVLFLSVMFCIIMLLIDLSFAFVDPRIRSQFARRKKALKAN